MKFKTDENLGRRCVTFLRSAGHDAITVREQGLAGADDEKIFDVCSAESRILLTLDHDFGNVLRFPPERSHGIVVLELPRRAGPELLMRVVGDLLTFMAGHPLGRELWIAEPGRIRVHQRALDEG